MRTLAALLGIVILAAIVGLIVGGWQAGWWFTAQNANRQYQVTQNGVSNQDTLRTQVTKDFDLLAHEDVQIAEAAGNPGLTGQLKVEAAATAGNLCMEGQQVNDAVALPQQQQSWFYANCNNGVVAPSSKYFIPSAGI